MSRLAVLAAASLGVMGAVPAAGVGQSAPPRLELPVACQPGRDCFVQQYFDHEPAKGETAFRDYRCGPKAYDGHDGTDIRVPTRAAMLRGVGVRAAAAGTVKNVRNTVADHRGTAADIARAKGTECGNGVVLSHPGGYETQYCHMKQGSIVVQPGQAVAVGATLGQVGQTGEAAFPHLHFSIRAGADEIDPFAPQSTAGCGRGGPGLWSPAAAAALAYRSPEVLNAGFTSTAAVTAEAVEDAGLSLASGTGPALLAYVRAIGLEKGDRQQLRVTAPGGAAFAESPGPELARPRAQQLLFTGKRNSAGRFAPGVYQARYTVTRGGKLVLEHRFEIRL
jgi:hypothetical protein